MNNHRSCLKMWNPARVFAVILIVFMAAAAVGRSEGPAVQAQWPKEELNKLPMLQFLANELGEAALQRLERDRQTTVVNGQTYLGFHFATPEEFDGPFAWLIASTAGAEAPKPWILLDDDGRQLGVFVPTAATLADHRRIVDRFPLTESISISEAPLELVKPKCHYYLIQPVASGNPAAHAVALSVKTPQGIEASGALWVSGQATPKRDTSDLVMVKMIEQMREGRVEDAMNYLEQELLQRVKDYKDSRWSEEEGADKRAWAAYYYLYSAAYREAHFGGGRDNLQWSIAINDRVFTFCQQVRDYHGAIDILHNLLVTLNRGGYHGRFTEVLDDFGRVMLDSGYRFESSSYPDLGPGFPFLPSVRRRDIPTRLPHANAWGRSPAPLRTPTVFAAFTARNFLWHANRLWRRGDWKESLEWRLWIFDFTDKRWKAGSGPMNVSLWHSSAADIASCIDAMGFETEALEMYERALKGPPDVGSLGRAMINHEIDRLELLMRMGRPVPDIVSRLEQLLVRSRGNSYINEYACQNTEVVLAKALIFTGREPEGLALLESLVGKGNQNARYARLYHWINIGRVEGVEEELKYLLKTSRESGQKWSEISLYATYADYLETTGRYQEALAMRREVIRLHRAFDYYTRLPLQLAKLALLLERLGDAPGSKTAATVALEGLRRENFPSGLAEQTRKKLGELGQKPRATALAPQVAATVDFQPTRSVAVPLKGAPWFSLFTLSNPSGTVEEGVLGVTGIPSALTSDKDGPADVSITLGTAGGPESLALRLEPGEYQIIAVTGAADIEGKANLIWTPGSGGKAIQSEVVVEAADEGVSSAVVQAGQFIDNPFYGVPIHHYYVTKEPKEHSEPFRFVASAAARVEIQDMEGKLLAIDSQGNGSLQDKGDELFVKSDGEGHVLLPLNNGACAFMIRLYPGQALPKEGLSLRIESLVNGNWTAHAEDRLMP